MPKNTSGSQFSRRTGPYLDLKAEPLSTKQMVKAIRRRRHEIEREQLWRWVKSWFRVVR